jgi:hypothetical protein
MRWIKPRCTLKEPERIVNKFILFPTCLENKRTGMKECRWLERANVFQFKSIVLMGWIDLYWVD